MNTLLIPCFNRPEFLWHCLDNLTQAEGIKDVHVIFSPDHGHTRDIPKVIAHYAPLLDSYEVRTVPRVPYRLTKQSHNVLSGYIHAAEQSTSLVFMVEEDIMVSRDFLTYHRAVHEAERDLFCSLSTKNHNRQVEVTDDPEKYYLTTLDYCSLGVCFRREIILGLIADHVTPAYYANPIQYCKDHFPDSIIGKSMVEQDGLIRRIQEDLGPSFPIAYPHAPRAFHAGFYGYNRQRAPSGTFERKRDHVGRTIYDREAMRVSSREFTDSEPVNLNIAPWTNLKRV